MCIKMLLLIASLSALCEANTVLNVGCLLELTNYWFSGYVKMFPEVFEYAFEAIHRRADLLEGFTLNMTIRDTQGHNGRAADQLIKLLKEGGPKVAVFGPTKSESLTVAGEITPVFNVLHVSFMAVTASIENKTVYPTLLTVNQASDKLNPVRIKIMKEFQWTRVGTIVHQSEIYMSGMTKFYGLLQDNNMTLITTSYFTSVDMFSSIMTSLKQFDVRIIFVSANGIYSAALFCEAYKHGLYGPQYVWILEGTFSTRQFMSVDRSARCTLEQVLAAADGHITLHNKEVGAMDEPTFSGKTPRETTWELRQRLNSWIVPPIVHSLIDAAWVLAVGLNNSIKYLEAKGLKLSDYSYSPDYLYAFMKGITETSFKGLSGQVSFDSHGQRIGEAFIRQQFKNESREVAYYDSPSDSLDWTVPHRSLWPGEVIPQDHLMIYEEYVPISLEALIAIAVVNCISVTITLAFQLINVLCRHKRSFTHSSTVLNSVAVLGCLLLHAFVFLEIVDGWHIEKTNIHCMAKLWLLVVSFTCVYGVMFLKAYKAYTLGLRKRTRRFKTKTVVVKWLVMFVLDCCVLTSWSWFFPLYECPHTELHKFQTENSHSMYVFIHCEGDYDTYWFTALYVYKGLLLIFGCFMCWQIRNVVTPVADCEPYNSTSVYNVAAICLLGVPLHTVLPIELTTVRFVFETSLVLFCSNMCMGLMFIPKIVDLKKSEDRLFVSVPPTFVNKSSRTTTLVRSRELSVVDLSKPAGKCHLGVTNKQLREQLAKESLAIEQLKERVLAATGDVYFYKSGEEYIVVQRKSCVTTERFKLQQQTVTSCQKNK